MINKEIATNKSILIWAMLFVISLPSHAQNCSLPQAQKVYERIEHLNGANKTNEAIEIADSLLEMLKTEKLHNCPDALWVRYEKGFSLEIGMDFLPAIEAYHEIIRASEDQKIWDLSAECHISLARCYEFLSRADDCRRNLDQAKTIIYRYGLEEVLGNYSGRFASYHRIFGSRDTAEIFARQAIEYGNKYDDVRTQIDGHLLMGIVAQDKETSISYFRKTGELFVSVLDFEAAAGMSSNIASRHIATRDFRLAEQELDSVYKYLELTDKVSKDYYNILSRYHDQKKNLFQENGQLDSAYFHLEKSREAERKSDWVIDQEEVSKKSVAFAIQKEKEKASALIWTTKLQRILGIFMSLIIIILSLFAYHFFSKRRKIARQNETISLRNEDLKEALHKQSVLLSEIHHRVKNNLQLVISLLTLQGNKAEDDRTVKSFEEISNKVRSIAIIHEQLYSEGEFEKINVRNYLNTLVQHFNKLELYEGQINIELDIKNVYLNLDTILPLGIICSELLSNSFKHAVLPQQKLEIKMKIQSLENKYIFNYRDNGPGYKDDLIQHSKKPIGMKLIQDMVRQLMADSSTFNNDGAVFNMIFVEKKVSAI